MSSAYAHQILKVIVAQLCQTIGWNTIQTTPLELLGDILNKYLLELTHQVHRYSELYGRIEPNIDDVALSFRDLNINLADLEEYITNVDPVPCSIDIPKFPYPKDSHLNFLKHGSKEVVTRPVHVHEHLPPMFPENEEKDGLAIVENSAEQQIENSAYIDEIDVLRKPDSFEPKRQKSFKEHEVRSTREITSVMMTTSGYISPAREGKLPDSKIPILLQQDAAPVIVSRQSNNAAQSKESSNLSMDAVTPSATKESTVNENTKLEKKIKRKQQQSTPATGGAPIDKERKKDKSTKESSAGGRSAKFSPMGPPPPKQMPQFHQSPIFPPSDSPMAVAVEQHIQQQQHQQQSPHHNKKTASSTKLPKLDKIKHKRASAKESKLSKAGATGEKLIKKRRKSPATASTKQLHKLSDLMSLGIGNVNAQLMATIQQQQDIEIKQEKLFGNHNMEKGGQLYSVMTSNTAGGGVVGNPTIDALNSIDQSTIIDVQSRPPMFEGKLSTEPDKHKLNIIKRISSTKKQEDLQKLPFPSNLNLPETSIFPIDDMKLIGSGIPQNASTQLPNVSSSQGKKGNYQRKSPHDHHHHHHSATPSTSLNIQQQLSRGGVKQIPEDLSIYVPVQQLKPDIEPIDFSSMSLTAAGGSIDKAEQSLSMGPGTSIVQQQQQQSSPTLTPKMLTKTQQKQKEPKEKKVREKKKLTKKERKITKMWPEFDATAATAAVVAAATQNAATTTNKIDHLPPTLGQIYDPTKYTNPAFPMYPWSFSGPGLIPNNPLFASFNMNRAPFPPLPYGLPTFEMMGFPRLKRPIIDISDDPLPLPLATEKVQCNVAPLVPESLKLDDLTSLSATGTTPAPITAAATTGGLEKSKNPSISSLSQNQLASHSQSDENILRAQQSISSDSIGIPNESVKRRKSVSKSPVSLRHITTIRDENQPIIIDDVVQHQQSSSSEGKHSTKSEKRKDKEHRKEKKDKDGGKIKKKKDKKDKLKNKDKAEKRKEEKQKNKELKEKKKIKREKKKEKDRVAQTTSTIQSTSLFGIISDGNGGVADASDIGGITAVDPIISNSNSNNNKATDGSIGTTIVPKLTLKLGNSPATSVSGTLAATVTNSSSSSSRPNTPDLHKKMSGLMKSKIKDEQQQQQIDERDSIESISDMEQTPMLTSGREQSPPELARISALVTRPPKQKQSVINDQRSSTITINTTTVTTTIVTATATATPATTSAICDELPLNRMESILPIDKIIDENDCCAGDATASSIVNYITPHYLNIINNSHYSSHSNNNNSNDAMKANQSRQSSYIDSDGNQVWICPACGRVDDGTPMIGCDGCDAWYHWVCVGIQVPPDANEDWYCRVCIAKKQEWQGCGDKKKKRKKKDKKEY